MKVILLSRYRGIYRSASGVAQRLELDPGEHDLGGEIVAFLRRDSPGLFEAVEIVPPADKKKVVTK